MTAKLYQFPKENVRVTLKRRLKVQEFYNQAWTLHDKWAGIAETWAKAGNLCEYKKAFNIAQDWFNVADSLGNELDNMGGKL